MIRMIRDLRRIKKFISVFQQGNQNCDNAVTLFHYINMIYKKRLKIRVLLNLIRNNQSQCYHCRASINVALTKINYKLLKNMRSGDNKCITYYIIKSKLQPRVTHINKVLKIISLYINN